MNMNQFTINKINGIVQREKVRTVEINKSENNLYNINTYLHNLNTTIFKFNICLSSIVTSVAGVSHLFDQALLYIFISKIQITRYKWF